MSLELVLSVLGILVLPVIGWVVRLTWQLSTLSGTIRNNQMRIEALEADQRADHRRIEDKITDGFKDMKASINEVHRRCDKIRSEISEARERLGRVEGSINGKFRKT